MSKELVFGDAGLGRNPELDERVLFRQCPSIRGKVVSIDRAKSGPFQVAWESGPVHLSWHPAEGLLLDEHGLS